MRSYGGSDSVNLAAREVWSWLDDLMVVTRAGHLWRFDAVAKSITVYPGMQMPQHPLFKTADVAQQYQGVTSLMVALLHDLLTQTPVAGLISGPMGSRIARRFQMLVHLAIGHDSVAFQNGIDDHAVLGK
jgi:hypothetical protein